MKTELKSKDRVCEECGLIHENGISWHGRCYKCGGELKPFDYSKVKLTAITPAGIKIYEQDDHL